MTEAQNPQLTFDCQKLRLYAAEFHRDTTFEQLIEAERMAALPILRELRSLPALEQIRLEQEKGISTIYPQRLADLVTQFCPKKKELVLKVVFLGHSVLGTSDVPRHGIYNLSRT